MPKLNVYSSKELNCLVSVNLTHLILFTLDVEEMIQDARLGTAILGPDSWIISAAAQLQSTAILCTVIGESLTKEVYI